MKLKEELLKSENQFDCKVDNEVLLKILDLIVEPEKPYLWLNPDVKDFYSFDNSKELNDIKVKNYKHMGKIKFPIAQ